MTNGNTPGIRLRDWRTAHDPKITLQSCADAVGVKHPTWIDWENNSRSPSLEKALAIELFTEGAVEIEAWGFDAETLATIRGVVRHRDAAAIERAHATSSLRDEADETSTEIVRPSHPAVA